MAKGVDPSDSPIRKKPFRKTDLEAKKSNRQRKIELLTATEVIISQKTKWTQERKSWAKGDSVCESTEDEEMGHERKESEMRDDEAEEEKRYLESAMNMNMEMEREREREREIVAELRNCASNAAAGVGKTRHTKWGPDLLTGFVIQ
ncbi:hypothetical protein VNO77_43135 [Canavalia gladiata]|uniref:Uncharacterized protein n=1 Tax=Canavalia gladiata TaxID=3824 RepID=A0AAN9JVX7_CANGL